MLVPIVLVIHPIVLAEGPGFQPWVFVLNRIRRRPRPRMVLAQSDMESKMWTGLGVFCPEATE